MIATQTPKLAEFEKFQLDRLTPQQRSDLARQYLDNGYPHEEVVKVLGEPNLTPTKAEIERKERADYLRLQFSGRSAADKNALEAELKKQGL